MTESRINVNDLKPADVALLKQVADEAADKAVRRFAITMGLDPDNPREAQSDAAWVRMSRKRDEGIWNKIVLSLVGAGVVGLTSAFWIGFQTVISGKPGPHP